MVYEPEKHRRHSIRLKDYDYSKAGFYFFSICTQERECLFGEIDNGVMQLNETGRIVDVIWCGLPQCFDFVILDEFVVMPNHVHGILQLTNRTELSSASPDSSPGTMSGSFCAVVQNFKSVSTRKINKAANTPGSKVWQRGYYERVIRNDKELQACREYIINNPMKWDLDKNNPVNL